MSALLELLGVTGIGRPLDESEVDTQEKFTSYYKPAFPDGDEGVTVAFGRGFGVHIVDRVDTLWSRKDQITGGIMSVVHLSTSRWEQIRTRIGANQIHDLTPAGATA